MKTPKKVRISSTQADNGREPKRVLLPLCAIVLTLFFLDAVTLPPCMSHEVQNAAASLATKKQKPIPKVVDLEQGDTQYLRILAGPPESYSMSAGRVVLGPSKSVGEHSTGSYEEVVVVLEGDGEMLLEDGSVLPLHSHTLAYIPPDTKHDARNTGEKPLCYLYIVCKAKKAVARTAGG